MKTILVIFIGFSSLFLSFACYTAKAEQTFPPGDFSVMAEPETTQVSQIIAPDVIALNDTRLINLSEIEFPDLYGAEEPGAFAQTALRVINDMLLGQTVRVYQTSKKDLGRMNRMGQHLAQVERLEGKAWVQGTLVALGLARVKTTAANRDMAPQLYILEMDAREKGLGIWAAPEYALLDTATIPQAALNRFQIAQGTITEVTSRKERLFINFGEDWKTDFTVTIPSSALKTFKKAGLDPLSWKGQKVRVRGWLEFYNGPNMEIDHPERLEFISATP